MVTYTLGQIYSYTMWSPNDSRPDYSSWLRIFNNKKTPLDITVEPFKKPRYYTQEYFQWQFY